MYQSPFSAVISVSAPVLLWEQKKLTLLRRQVVFLTLLLAHHPSSSPRCLGARTSLHPWVPGLQLPALMLPSGWS